MKLTDFDRIVCVCLDSRRNDWRSLENQFAERGAKVERFIVGKGEVLPKESYDLIDSGDIPSSWGSQFTPNAYYCWKAHRAIIKKAKDDGLNNILMLEDDCLLTSEFDEVLGKVSQQIDENEFEWDSINFGQNLKWAKATQLSPNVLKLNSGAYCFHSILLKNTLFDHFLSFDPIGPYDWIYSMYTQPEYNCLGVWPAIGMQKAGFSYVNGCHSDYTHWLKETGDNHIV